MQAQLWKNTQNLFFAKNGCGPATPLRKTQLASKNFKKNSRSSFSMQKDFFLNMEL